MEWNFTLMNTMNMFIEAKIFQCHSMTNADGRFVCVYKWHCWNFSRPFYYIKMLFLTGKIIFCRKTECTKSFNFVC